MPCCPQGVTVLRFSSNADGTYTVHYNDALNSSAIITPAQYAAATALLSELNYTPTPIPVTIFPPIVPLPVIPRDWAISAPVATPAGSSQPTSTVAPAVTPQNFLGPPVQAPGAVTPSGAPISTTTGAPASGTVIASVQGEIDSLMTWLKGSLIGGIPNWLLVGGAVAGLMMFGGDGSSTRRRR